MCTCVAMNVALVSLQNGLPPSKLPHSLWLVRGWITHKRPTLLTLSGSTILHRQAWAVTSSFSPCMLVGRCTCKGTPTATL